MFAHDPSDMCLNYVQNTLKIPKEDIVLFSLGTGWIPHFYESESNHDWGYYQWLPKITTVLWDCMVKKTEWICQQSLGDKYFKLNPILETDIPFDDPRFAAEFTNIAKKTDLFDTLNWIKKNIYSDD